jgi:uncharacterized FAD-dependent dehydrogenase
MPAAHPLEALRQAAAQTLGIAIAEILDLQVFKRSFDARTADILAVFIVDVQLAPACEARLLAQHANHAHIAATPDMGYQPPAHAPAKVDKRPVVVGFGPCGMFAALLLAVGASATVFIHPTAWGDVERYLHEQRVETCWLKQRMNRVEPELAAKIKTACQRLTVEDTPHQ